MVRHASRRALPLLVLMAVASWPAAARAVTPETAKPAFDARLAARFPGAARQYSTCPSGQDLGGVVSCFAELRAAGRWHFITAQAIDDDQGGVAFVQQTARSWRRRFRRYSTRLVGHSFGAPGVVSVNSPIFDWEWLTGGAWSVRHRHRFALSAYDGNNAGLGRFYEFHCRARARLVRCHNAFGDAMRYRPYGGPLYMFYPTPDYSSESGGTKLHLWVHPHHWTDEDTLTVRHARWRHWGRRSTIAHVHVIIAGGLERGPGTVRLSDPGYCRVAGAFVYRRERDRGGPWGPSSLTTNYRHYCRTGSY